MAGRLMASSQIYKTYTFLKLHEHTVPGRYRSKGPRANGKQRRASQGPAHQSVTAHIATRHSLSVSHLPVPMTRALGAQPQAAVRSRLPAYEIDTAMSIQSSDIVRARSCQLQASKRRDMTKRSESGRYGYRAPRTC